MSGRIDGVGVFDEHLAIIADRPFIVRSRQPRCRHGRQVSQQSAVSGGMERELVLCAVVCVFRTFISHRELCI